MFGWFLLICWVTLWPILVASEATKTPAVAHLRELPESSSTTSPQTQKLTPIFQCTGAGSQLLVSLGGDGSSIYVSCADIKS